MNEWTGPGELPRDCETNQITLPYIRRIRGYWIFTRVQRRNISFELNQIIYYYQVGDEQQSYGVIGGNANHFTRASAIVFQAIL